MRCLTPLLFLALATAPAGAQLSPAPKPSPGAAQRVSLLAFVVPVTAGIVLIAPEEASEARIGVGAAIFWSGAILGPAVGYWVGGAAGRGWLGAGIRTGAAVLTAAAMAGDEGFTRGSEDVAAVGVLAILGHGVYDIIRIPPVLSSRRAELAVAPAPGWIRGTGLGVQLTW